MSEDSKEIRIRAILDASTFDKGIQEIQQKIAKLNQSTSTQKTLGKDPVLGSYAQKAFGDFSKETQQEMQKVFQAQRQEAINQQITLKGKQAELNKINQIDGQMTKQQKERVDLLKKEIDLLKEKHRQTLSTAAETQKVLDKLKPENAGAGGGGGIAGGAGGSAQQPQDPNNAFTKMLKNIITGAGSAALLKGAFNAGITIADDLITRERKINVNNAASANIMSRELREQFQGRGSRGMFYLPERAKAMEAASREQDRMSYLDVAKAGGSVMAGVGGALAGAKIGGMAGSFLGPMGTLIGGGLGAVAGGIGGFFGTSNERTRARIYDPEKYKSIMTKEGLEKYEQNLAAEKAKNPLKVMAQEYFEQNRGSLAAMQKMIGAQSDLELTGAGGVLRSNMAAGLKYGGIQFNQQTIEDQMQALASGGAMTSGIRDLGGMSAVYNRQFNLSNAGQLMGRLQGNVGGSATQTEQAYQRLLQEAVRAGVNASTMPRELEKMTQITAELATSGGVFAQGTVDLFGAGTTGFNQRSLQATAAATQDYQQTAKAAGGWEGQMGYGFLQSEKARAILGGKQLTSKQMNYLNQLSASELDEAGFNRAGAVVGVESGVIRQLLESKDKWKQTRTEEEASSLTNLGEFFKRNKAFTPEQRKKLTSQGEGAGLYGAAEAELMTTQKEFGSLSPAEREAQIFLKSNILSDNTGGDLDIAKKAVEAQKIKKEIRTPSVEEGAEAVGDITRMNALNDQYESLKAAAKAHTETAELYAKQFNLLIDATKKGADSMELIAAELSRIEEKQRLDAASRGEVPAGKSPGE